MHQEVIKYPFLDFFAGSGLVSLGFEKHFDTVWANDNCPKKGEIFKANLPNIRFCSDSIELVTGEKLPKALVSWASFPCQDLSLAGNLSGINGSRSGLVWQWLRLMDEMDPSPPILVAENVVGLIKANRGKYYSLIHNELAKSGYIAGPIILDAKHWVPQSRPRIFIIAVKKDLDVSNHISRFPNWLHDRSIIDASAQVDNMVFWKIKKPANQPKILEDIIDFDEYVDESKSQKNLKLIPRDHYDRLLVAANNGFKVFAGYKRSREGKQRLELRFDEISGCLRTAKGGSSKQYVIYIKGGKLQCRLMTPREASLLMGAPPKFKLPKNKNDAYSAMGDAVALPVSKFLANTLIKYLADIAHEKSFATASAV